MTDMPTLPNAPAEAAAAAIAGPASRQERGGVRPMRRTDVPAVARLFLKVFRAVDKPADPALQDYLDTLCFTAPDYDEGAGTQIYERPDGAIGSALLAVPMRFVAAGRILPGRLLGVFMSDRGADAGGAARLILGLRPRRDDFSFCDSASPTSRKHLVAIGGIPITAQNLEWTRSFRPVTSLLMRIEARVPGGRLPGLAVMGRPIDALLRRLRPERSPAEAEGAVVPLPLPAFLEVAPQLVAHYVVRPLWEPEELAWLVSLAARATRLGSLSIRAVRARDDRLLGAFVHYAAPGRSAQVLNVLSWPGSESTVLAAMFRHLDETGHVQARGRAQPALMAGLAQQRWLVFRHRAFAVALTRVPEVADAVARGDVYVGGLAGEDWSRLLSDFG